MTWTFEVLVTLKPGLADPAGKAVEASLPSMGWNDVSNVHVGRHVRLDVEAPTQQQARARVEEVARGLLANPVIEDFRIVENQRSAAPG